MTANDGILSLSYTVRGQGKPLIWLYTKDRFDCYPLNAILSALAQRFSVYAIESRLIDPAVSASEFNQYVSAVCGMIGRLGEAAVLCGDIVEAPVLLALLGMAPRITKLVIYAPPMSQRGVNPLEVSSHMAAEFAAGEVDSALLTYCRELLHLNPQQLSTLVSRPCWKSPGLDRVVEGLCDSTYYVYDEALRVLPMPTLLVADLTAAGQPLVESEVLENVLPNLQVRSMNGFERVMASA